MKGASLDGLEGTFQSDVHTWLESPSLQFLAYWKAFLFLFEYCLSIFDFCPLDNTWQSITCISTLEARTSGTSTTSTSRLYCQLLGARFISDKHFPFTESSYKKTAIYTRSEKAMGADSWTLIVCHSWKADMEGRAFLNQLDFHTCKETQGGSGDLPIILPFSCWRRLWHLLGSARWLFSLIPFWISTSSE